MSAQNPHLALKKYCHDLLKIHSKKVKNFAAELIVCEFVGIFLSDAKFMGGVFMGEYINESCNMIY